MTHKQDASRPRRSVVAAVFDFLFEPCTARCEAQCRHHHRLFHRPVW